MYMCMTAMTVGMQYPVTATQWHPEKNVFEWATHLHVPHSFEAVSLRWKHTALCMSLRTSLSCCTYTLCSKSFSYDQDHPGMFPKVMRRCGFAESILLHAVCTNLPCCICTLSSHHINDDLQLLFSHQDHHHLHMFGSPSLPLCLCLSLSLRQLHHISNRDDVLHGALEHMKSSACMLSPMTVLPEQHGMQSASCL